MRSLLYLGETFSNDSRGVWKKNPKLTSDKLLDSPSKLCLLVIQRENLTLHEVLLGALFRVHPFQLETLTEDRSRFLRQIRKFEQ